MKNIYLCGPVTGLSYLDASNWRTRARAFLLGYTLNGVSPLRSKPVALADVKNFNAMGGDIDHAMTMPKGVTMMNRFDATRCDVLLANFIGASKPSIGSVMEMAWADAARVPIILAIEAKDNPNDHFLVDSISGWRVPDLDEALEIAVSIING